MSMVMVKCPQTGRAIPTGIKTDRDSFTSITPGSRGKPGLTSRAPGRGVKARTHLDSTQLGMRSQPCWKC